MKRLLLPLLLAGCVAEIEPVIVVPDPEPVEEPRRQFTDDNIPFDLTAGADLNAIPDYWIEIFCGVGWESRPEPFTGIEQWNPCLRPDMFGRGPRPEPVAPQPVEALAVADPLARAEVDPIVQVIPEPVTVAPAPAASEFDIPPDPTLFLNPDGSFSRRAQ